MPYSVPAEVRDFVTKQLTAFDQLEVLMLVSDVPDTEWTVNSVFKIVQSTRELVEERLEGLVRAGLLTRTGDPAVYRYAPANEELREQIAALSTAYRLGRHQLIEIIYSAPRDPLREFSDAFKFKRKS